MLDRSIIRCIFRFPDVFSSSSKFHLMDIPLTDKFETDMPELQFANIWDV